MWKKETFSSASQRKRAQPSFSLRPDAQNLSRSNSAGNDAWNCRHARLHERKKCANLVSTLQVRSARAGEVIGFRLDDLLESFQKSGAELAAIGSVDSIEVVAAIPQSEVSKVSLDRGAPVDIYLSGRNLALRGAIVSYEQSATQPSASPH